MSKICEECKAESGYNFNVDTTYLEEENYAKSETLYRKQFLKVFNIAEYNFIEINKIIPIVYDAIKNETFFIELSEALTENTKLPFEIKKEDLIILLFQYEYFHYFHLLLKKLYQDKKYDIEKQNLINIIHKKHIN